MKKIFITLILLLQVAANLHSQQSEEEFFIHDGEDSFYLLMPVSDVYKILGDPVVVQRRQSTISNHGYDTVILGYSGISFVYYDFGTNPEVLVIVIVDANKQLGNHFILGQSKDEIIVEYGKPHFIRTINENINFLYEFSLSLSSHLELQLRFNTFGICDGVVLTHSGFFI